ncbi:helix-turn-helix domain-containing protein [Nocardia sp. CDC153]|uniref:helix-turn-helix domain-containing protein n=1 Tax=Nocardia sp. CDC153 TaxID=3112167 RepID=UPI002DB92DEA|nr:helix-turn-helix domain-containing protein [Nocardia sp. CDC153]MEC3957795.1 helix-turn-helix domain-containing protein [Nocardia sp. CDC153]
MTTPITQEWIDQNRGPLHKFVRRYRENKGLTQRAVAEAMGVDAKHYAKLEGGRIAFHPDYLAYWCKAVDLPQFFLRLILANIASGLYDPNPGSWPSRLTAIDQERLDALPYVAMHLGVPRFDVLQINDIGARTLVGLETPAPDALAPKNLFDWFFNNQYARTSIANWQTIVARLLYGFKILGPVALSAEEMREVLAPCVGHPQFARLWNADFTQEQFDNTLIILKNPDTRKWENYRMSAWNSVTPVVHGEFVLMTPTSEGPEDPGAYVDPLAPPPSEAALGAGILPDDCAFGPQDGDPAA